MKELQKVMLPPQETDPAIAPIQFAAAPEIVEFATVRLVMEPASICTSPIFVAEAQT